MIKDYKKVYEIEPKDDKSYGWKQKYNPNNLKTLDHQPVKLGTKSLADENRSDHKQPMQLKQLRLNEISKSLWINLSRKNFSSLIENVVDNLDIKDYKTTLNNRRYDLKNAEKFLLKIINWKISKNEALKFITIW